MTVEWIRYAQSLTARADEGHAHRSGDDPELGPSCATTSRVRSRCFQLALAIREEVLDLERAGVRVIQIDEAALREGLPLRKSQWKNYLDWAVESFRVTANGVRDETQIHTHHGATPSSTTSSRPSPTWMPTSSPSRRRVPTWNCSTRSTTSSTRTRSGRASYDIHSPNIPTQAHIEQLMRKAAERIPATRLWVNPDCGLKTRAWDEVIPALANMVAAAKALRAA